MQAREDRARRRAIQRMVGAHKNFEHCIFLALFNFREGRIDQAVQAVAMSQDQPYVEAYDDGASKFYLGDDGALIAYFAGEYDLCLSMCKKLLADKTTDPWGHLFVGRTEQRIQAAALFMKGDQTAATALMRRIIDDGKHDNVVSTDTVKSDEALLDAMQKNNTGFVKDFRNWVNDVVWFSPSNRSVALYPASWLSENIDRDLVQL